MNAKPKSPLKTTISHAYTEVDQNAIDKGLKKIPITTPVDVLEGDLVTVSIDGGEPTIIHKIERDGAVIWPLFTID